MKFRLAFFALLLAGFAAGCASDSADSERGPLGKSDAVGSCAESTCDGPAPVGNCWCDAECAEIGDCCSDYEAVCEAAPLCGGLANLPCPDGMTCVENTEDGCDPESGATDCPGMCVDEEPASCGGFAGLTCGEGQYCHYDQELMCGAADHLGECRDMPDFCPEVFAPVCGCDGNTYGNACEANAAGTSVVSEGECAATEPALCGGFAGLACPEEGQYCHFDAELACGNADRAGECRFPPDFCTEQFAPVCGCDGNTYSNACFANAAGTSVLHEGECAE